MKISSTEQFAGFAVIYTPMQTSGDLTLNCIFAGLVINYQPTLI